MAESVSQPDGTESSSGPPDDSDRPLRPFFALVLLHLLLDGLSAVGNICRAEGDDKFFGDVFMDSQKEPV